MKPILQLIILLIATFTITSDGNIPRGITLVYDFNKNALVYDEEPSVVGKDYKTWKQELLKELSKPDFTFFDWLGTVSYQANYGLTRPDPSLEPNRVLYPYNFLRELFGQASVSSLEEVDRSWLKEVMAEAELDLIIRQKGETPTAKQKELVDEGVRLVGLKQQVRAISSIEPFQGQAITYGGYQASDPLASYITMCKTPDLDSRLIVLYHEIGHIIHGDAQHSKSTSEGYREQFLHKPEVQSDQKEIKHYLELGMHALSSLSHTRIGKILLQALAEPGTKEVLKRYGYFWIPPENEEDKRQGLYGRTTEQRADLFALRQLLKLGEISPMLNFITILIFKDELSIIRKGSYYVHPSDVERAIYIIGFLAAHGFNVAALISAWEKQGTCRSNEEVNYAHFLTPPSVIRQQIEKAQKLWKM